MIHYKTPSEIKKMTVAGQKLSSILPSILQKIKPGVKTKEIDSFAEKKIKEVGGFPAFKTVEGYNWATCIAVNEQLVHTPPSERILQPGDVVTLDIGLQWQGYCVDYAYTVALNPISEEVKKFLQVGEDTLEKGIEILRKNRDLFAYASFVFEEIKKNGYSVVKNLTGHGIGRSLHEDPFVFNYPEPELKQVKVKDGLTIAVEIIYSMGSGKMVYESDGWSLKTSDNSLAACFEHTIAFVNGELKILV